MMFNYFCDHCGAGTPHVVLHPVDEGELITVSNVKCSHCSEPSFDVEHFTDKPPVYDSKRLVPVLEDKKTKCFCPHCQKVQLGKAREHTQVRDQKYGTFTCGICTMRASNAPL